jgi:hypothetical protein
VPIDCWKRHALLVESCADSQQVAEASPFVPDASGTIAFEPALWQLIPSTMTRDERTSAYVLIKKWLPYEERIFVFIQDPAELLFSLKKYNALGLSHPQVDVKSPALHDVAIRATERAAEGALIFAGDISQLPPEMRDIYAHLEERWNFQEIDSLDGITVIRLKPKSRLRTYKGVVPVTRTGRFAYLPGSLK